MALVVPSLRFKPIQTLLRIERSSLRGFEVDRTDIIAIRRILGFMIAVDDSVRC